MLWAPLPALSRMGEDTQQQQHPKSGVSALEPSAPEQRLLLLAGVPQVLQEAEHDIGRAAASAVPRRPRLLHRQRVIPQQLHQHAPALPVGVWTRRV